MHDLIVLLVHVITTVLRLPRPGGLRSVVAESVLIKHQLLIVNHSRLRAPNLRALRSANRGILFALDKADSPSAGSDRIKTVHLAAFPSGSGTAKIPTAVFAKTPNQAGAQRSKPGTDSRRC